MTQTDLAQEEPDPRLVGTPAQVTIRLLVNEGAVCELKTERPSEFEARAFCFELQREIETLIHKGKTYIQ
jgi:hypothetical protein